MIRPLIAIAGSVVLDALRRKVLWIVVVFAAILAVAIPELPVYGLGVARQVFREVAQALMYVGAMILALTLAANRVPGEVEKRTAYNVLARDVRRWQYLLGSWVGVFVVLAGAVVAFCVVTQGVAMFVYGDPMWRLWQGALAVLLEAGVVAAFAMAVSTLVGPVTVTVASMAFLFIGHVRTSLVEATGIRAAAYLPSLDVFNVVDSVAHGAGLTLVYIGSMSVAFGAWVATLLVLASFAFGRKDL